MLTESMAAPGKLSNTVLFIKSETLVLLLFRKVTDSCVGGGKGLLVRSHVCVCARARDLEHVRMTELDSTPPPQTIKAN